MATPEKVVEASVWSQWQLREQRGRRHRRQGLNSAQIQSKLHFNLLFGITKGITELISLEYQDWLGGSSQVWWILFLLLLTTSVQRPPWISFGFGPTAWAWDSLVYPTKCHSVALWNMPVWEAKKVVQKRGAGIDWDSMSSNVENTGPEIILCNRFGEFCSLSFPDLLG